MSKFRYHRGGGRGETRGSLIKKIHIAQTQLGFDDDTYRDFLGLHGNNKNSCSHMTVPELYSVFNAFLKAGFKPSYRKKATTNRRPGTGKKDQANPVKHGGHWEKPEVGDDKKPLMNKIEALLSDEELPWSYAEGIAKRMFGKQRLQWCNQKQLQSVMIALQQRQRKQRSAMGQNDDES